MTNPRTILLSILSSGALVAGCATDEAPPTTPREQKAADMERHHAAVVEQFDADGDGVMSAAEREAAHRHHFDQADTDDDGALSRAELQGLPGPAAMLLEHLAEIDQDGDGALSYDEVTRAMEAHHRHHQP